MAWLQALGSCPGCSSASAIPMPTAQAREELRKYNGRIGGMGGWVGGEMDGWMDGWMDGTEVKK